MSRVALVTGANRGLGYETVRQLREQGWEVVLTARSRSKAEAAAAELGAVPARLEVTSSQDAEAVAALVRERFGGLDALVNNAGAIFEQGPEDALSIDPELVLRALDTNALGALRVTQALAPLLRSGARVVNVSSGMGGIEEMGTGYAAYRMSKTLLNGLTKLLSNELGARGVAVNAVCPGWVRTDMGGPGADRDVAHGASGIVLAATASDLPTGRFLRDGQIIPW